MKKKRITKHNIKIRQEYARRILDGEKTFEVRYNDRDYQRGDILEMRIIDKDDKPVYLQPDPKLADDYCVMIRKISYIHTGYGMAEGFVILGLEEAPLDET